MGSGAATMTREVDRDAMRITHVSGTRREYAPTGAAPPKTIILSDYQREKLRALRFS